MNKKLLTTILESEDIFTSTSQKGTPVDAGDLEAMSDVTESISMKKRNIQEHEEYEAAEGYDWNEGHPDHEGEMAVSQLHMIAEMAEMLLDIVGEDDELPGWVQYKLGRAYSDMTDLFGYIESKSHDRLGDEDYEEDDYEDEYGDDLEDFEDVELEEAKGKKKNTLWGNIRARRKAGKARLKPGQKGYPKTLNIESNVRRIVRSMVRRSLKK
jgi:hypothetical protein